MAKLNTRVWNIVGWITLIGQIIGLCVFAIVVLVLVSFFFI